MLLLFFFFFFFFFFHLTTPDFIVLIILIALSAHRHHRRIVAAAIKHFNRTFIDTSRIFVEVSKRPGDEDLGRPWSRYSKGSSRYQGERYCGRGGRERGAGVWILLSEWDDQGLVGSDAVPMLSETLLFGISACSSLIFAVDNMPPSARFVLITWW